MSNNKPKQQKWEELTASRRDVVESLTSYLQLTAHLIKCMEDKVTDQETIDLANGILLSLHDLAKDTLVVSKMHGVMEGKVWVFREGVVEEGGDDALEYLRAFNGYINILSAIESIASVSFIDLTTRLTPTDEGIDAINTVHANAKPVVKELLETADAAARGNVTEEVK